VLVLAALALFLMPEQIAGIDIPEPPDLGLFPLRLQFGTVEELSPRIARYQFGAANGKLEQRFVLGAPVRRWRLALGRLSPTRYATMRDWWESADGGYAQFDLDVPTAAGGTRRAKVRFEAFSISFEHLANRCATASGVTVVEIPTGDGPTYAVTGTDTRVPGATLAAGLLEQKQELIPLLKVIPRGEAGSRVMWLSDRRVTVAGQLYQPRILSWGPITMTMDENSDSASFLLGNADNVFTKITRAVKLQRAKVEFRLFHVGTGRLLELYAGECNRYPNSWDLDPIDGTMALYAMDPFYEASAWPPQKMSEDCWKVFDSEACPYATAGSGGDPTGCAKTWEACQSHSMTRYFGGIRVAPQLVKLSQGGRLGFGRSTMQASSVINETTRDAVIPQVYTDIEMPVPGLVIAGRDESEFRTGLGVISQGPIASFSADLGKHKLDNQPPHDPAKGGGWRAILGTDPAGVNDFVGISQAPWNVTPAGSTLAAGVALAEIRRTDEKGRQLFKASDMSMQVAVTGGMGSWVWPGSDSAAWVGSLTNPFWIALRAALESKGFVFDPARTASLAAMEALFDRASVVAAAAIADTFVSQLIGSAGTEKQFVFRSRVGEQRPLREWLGEILRPALGYWTTRFGRIRFGVRTNATATEAFTTGNVLMGGFRQASKRPLFSRLFVNWTDEEWGFAAAPPLDYRDEDLAMEWGDGIRPDYTSSSVSLLGCTRKSQAARYAITYAREVIGGITDAERRKHADCTLQTTALGLVVEPGGVVSYAGPETDIELVKFRAAKMELRDDMALTIYGPTVTDSMYDMTTGPRPESAPSIAPPAETFPAAQLRQWMPDEVPAGPLLGAEERTFAVSQEYEKKPDGSTEARLVMTGRLPVTRLVDGAAVAKVRTSSVVAGGAIPGGQVIYACVAPYNAAGEYGPPSNVVIHRMGAGFYDLHLDGISWPVGTWTGYALFAGHDSRTICLQLKTAGALPTNVTFSGVLDRNTEGVPSIENSHVIYRTYRVVHGGVNGGLVTGVAAGSITISDFVDTVGGVDNFAGRALWIWADASDGSAPPWVFGITAFDAATGMFTVTPSPIGGTSADSVEVGDVGGVALQATAATATTIADAKLVNQSAPAGLIPGAEAGLEIRIIAGTGRDQIRRVIDNDATGYTVDPPWDVVPDATSIFIVVAPGAQYESATAPVDVRAPGVPVEVKMPIGNLSDQLVLVTGALVDREGRETSPELTAWRLIWAFGEPPAVVQVDAGYTVGREEDVLLLDLLADGSIQLPAAADRQGRPLIVKRAAGSAVPTLDTAGAETIDGAASLVPVEGEAITLIADKASGGYLVVGNNSGAGVGGGATLAKQVISGASGTVTLNHTSYTHFDVTCSAPTTFATPINLRDGVPFFARIAHSGHAITFGAGWPSGMRDIIAGALQARLIRCAVFGGALFLEGTEDQG
jgi:hypothetical protein